jgi:2-polyprenyl-3-methyl-5-hydroxy-6-metoxy-1,4-benzoquinol methylase
MELEKQYTYADHLRTHIIEMIPKNSGRVLGSIGCGQARTEGALVEMGFEVHGVDMAAQAIEVAKTRITSAKVINGDELMPFAEASLDGLLLLDVLEHMPHAWDRLAHFSKMVKKGGWVIISVPNMLFARAIKQYLIKGDWPERDAGIFDETHIQFMTHSRVARWAHQAGLQFEFWQDAYPYGYWEHKFYKATDLATFRLGRRFLHEQAIGLFKRD